ncbi:metal-dependent hydrolase [Natrinema salsiterrestre]|uniref:Metal-dependent hydrolase n=1 Tax=Natrinema salsiterrestre TaxID=2950540 RepID=A0A9Q4Q479_9EURY|nr:metal-dependent hydrolase [Natrinema salsiterrestre]MDF9747062.1 metal-dependent hydrolase [Natrinema salsiterrestre]
MEPGRVLFLTVAFATHAVVGLALVRGFTAVDPRTGTWLGVVFGLLPDADFLFPAAWGWPFVHRGITHSPVFALAVVAAVYAIRRTRAAALAAALAIGSHLLIDSLSPMGIQWLYPIETTWSPGLDVHGAIGTILLWSLSLGVLAWRTNDLAGVRRSSARDGDDSQGQSN